MDGQPEPGISAQVQGRIEFGTEVRRGFTIGNVLRTADHGDIHFSSLTPESYDGSRPCALFLTLPGWEGLWFQGAGADMAEDFCIEASRNVEDMIVLSAQLDDWGPTSADMAIAFVFDHAGELQVDTGGYLLWEGSVGARMAAWLGSYGTASFGERALPRPGAVIIQYTGLSQVFGNEPPTYSCVGTSDGLASWRVMQARTDAIRADGTDVEIEVFSGLSHGFGLGTGTVAEGWIDRAVKFWERNVGGM